MINNDNIEKRIVASTHVDKHKMIIPREELEKMAEQANCRDCTQRIGINHISTMPPIGKIISGSVKKCSDGEYVLENEMEYFNSKREIKFSKRTLIMKTSRIDKRPFVLEKSKYDLNKVMVDYDYINFSKDGLKEFKHELNNGNETKIGTMIMRKSVVPPPEIIINIPISIQMTISVGISIVLKSALEKIGEKLGNEIGNDVCQFYTAIKKIVTTCKKCMLHDNRPTVYIFRAEYEFQIEFIISGKTSKQIINAINTKKLGKILRKTRKELESTDLKITYIQFILDNKGKWELNYMLTSDGGVIGTYESFDREKAEIRKMKLEIRK